MVESAPKISQAANEYFNRAKDIQDNVTKLSVGIRSQFNVCQMGSNASTIRTKNKYQ